MHGRSTIRAHQDAICLTATRPRFDPSINYYQILDVPPGASKEQITRAYRQLIRVTHPDTFQDPRARAKAEERAKIINAAYTVLSRSDVRAEYDKTIRATAVSDALMQRYTGNGASRPAPPRARPKSPPPHIVRAQRRAYNAAVRQLLLVTAAFMLIVIAVAVVFGLAQSGLGEVFGSSLPIAEMARIFRLCRWASSGAWDHA